MKSRLRLTVAVVCLSALGGAPARGQTAVVPPPGAAAADSFGLAAAVAERVKREMDSQNLVGLSVGLARGTAVVHTAAFGFEDREKSIAASNGTMFRWASVSKPLTAVVAMRLAGEGRLDLDADVRAIVPEFPQKPWPVTARQLLGHLGGVVHYTNGRVIKTQREYAVEHPFKDAVLALDTFKESPLVCEPGTKHSYTTHGYLLLAAAVQKASGKPYSDLVTERIARPAGMTTLRPDYQWETIPRRAKGYRRTGADEFVESSNTDVSWKLAGGGWISTAGDMARFGAAMFGDALVDEETRAAMWSPQKTRGGESTGYGLGSGVMLKEGRLEVAHGGSQEKARTRLLILPEAPGGGVVVAVMCNSEWAELKALTADLAELVKADAAEKRATEPAGGGR